MSGPIVRRYGFPNFDKIFGDRPLEHGAGEDESPKNPAEGTGDSVSKSEMPEPIKADRMKKTNPS